MSRQLRRGPRRILIVDGYNVINAREGGAGMSASTLADAREHLVAELMDYAGYSEQQVVLVFDAWMSDRTQRTEEQRGAVTVVYTQKGEIADRYIERLCDSLANDIELRRVEVRVASSDGLEQTIILGRGASRMSARELMLEMQQLRASGIQQVAQRPASRRNPIAEHLPPEVRQKLDEMRKGHRK
ncbi:MAG: NYN domain-containing protein [Oscillospiraceae bacterium]|nr:NYN domain-containing protein [Oscillospiraceae bacterium]